MFTLIQSQNQSVEGNEAIRQINIELVTKEIARLGKIKAHEMSMDRYEEIDEIQEEIDELENTLDELNHNKMSVTEEESEDYYRNRLF